MSAPLIPGTEATFTYGLMPDANSEIYARLGHRNGQRVEILAVVDAEPDCEAVYRVRFPDGHEDDAFASELSGRPGVLSGRPGVKIPGWLWPIAASFLFMILCAEIGKAVTA